MRKISLNNPYLVYCKITSGMQPKWFIDNKYIKKDTFAYEGLAECMASDILDKSNMDYVAYYPIVIIKDGKEISGCISDNFLEESENLHPVNKLLYCVNERLCDLLTYRDYAGAEDEYISKCVNGVETTTGIKNYGRYLTSMLEFDKIILNEDRHFSNMAVIQHRGKSETFSYPAPFFDHGRGFALNDYLWKDNKTIAEIVHDIDARPFSESFTKQVHAAEKLYGGRAFATSYGMKDLARTLKRCEGYYSSKVLTRISDVFSYQMTHNLQYFIGRERQDRDKAVLRKVTESVGVPVETDVCCGCMSIKMQGSSLEYIVDPEYGCVPTLGNKKASFSDICLKDPFELPVCRAVTEAVGTFYPDTKGKEIKDLAIGLE